MAKENLFFKVQDNKILGALKIKNLPLYPHGELQLKMEFYMNQYGKIQIQYTPDILQESKVKVEFDTQSTSIENFFKQHVNEEYKELPKDHKRRKKQEITNTINQSLWTVERLIEDHVEVLPNKLILRAQKFIKKTKAIIFRKKSFELIELIEDLNKIGKKILKTILKK